MQESIPLPTATQAFRLASRLIQEKPVLLAPPLLMLMLSSALLGAAPSPVTLLSLGLLNLAVTGGWFRLIFAAAREEALRWDEFLAGVGRHFYPLVAGTLVFFCAMMAAVVPLMLVGLRWGGDLRKLPVKAIQDQLVRGDFLLDPQWLTMVTRWSILCCAGVTIYAIASYFLLLWNQVVVLRQTQWVEGWRESIRLTVRYWRPLCAILTVNGLAWLVAAVLNVAGRAAGPLAFLLTVLAAFASLVAEVYFRTAYATFTFLAEPKAERAANAEGPEKQEATVEE